MNDTSTAGGPGASGTARSQVAQAVQQLEPRAQASPSPTARASRSTSQTQAGAAPAPAPRQSAGRKRKSRQKSAAAGADLSGASAPAPPLQPTFADVVAGRVKSDQALPILVGEVQKLKVELGQARAFGEETYNQLQQERQATTERLEHLHRHSKRNNLVVLGVPESSAYSTPTALAMHVQGVLFQTAPIELTLVRSAFRLGKWRQDQDKPRAVLVELVSIAAKHKAFQASSRLRAARIRLDEDLTPQQMKQRRGLSTDFQCLKAKSYKPFFRGATLKYRDGAAYI